MICAILSYNHPELTIRCVRSALNFFKASHIILIHNGSTEKHQQSLRKEFPHLHHRSTNENCGFTGGCNLALKESFSLIQNLSTEFLKKDSTNSEAVALLKKNPWVLFLTNDTQLIQMGEPPLQEGFFAPLIFFRKKDRIDSVGGSLILSKAKLKHCKSSEEFNQQFNKEINQQFNQKFQKSLPYIPGTAFLIDQKTWETVGPFDEKLGTYWEDVEFSLRALQKKQFIGTHTQIQLLHAVGKTCHKKSLYTTYYYQRNRRKVCLIYSQRPWLLFFYFLFLEDSKSIFFYLKKGRFKDLFLFLKGIGQAYKYFLLNPGTNRAFPDKP